MNYIKRHVGQTTTKTVWHQQILVNKDNVLELRAIDMLENDRIQKRRKKRFSSCQFGNQTEDLEKRHKTEH